MTVEWNISCVNCEFIGKFEDVVGIEYKKFLEILRGICPKCLSEAETFVENDRLLIICKKCLLSREFKNLKNLEEKYLKDKKYAFLYILPKCPKCGSACRVFPNVV